MTRIAALRHALAERILLIDGATGTALESMQLEPEAYGGKHLAGCNEALVLHAPNAIRRLHRLYLEAGADIVETDTFGATPVVLGEYGLADEAFQINQRAAELAREVADAFATPEYPRWVAGSMGPTTKSLTLTGGS